MIVKHIPLLCGVLCPISLFLNIQAFFISGWILKKQQSLATLVLALVSIAAGLTAVICTWMRMLEKKIKWSTILVMYSSVIQAFYLVLLVLVLVPTTNWSETRALEGLFFTILSSFFSISVGLLTKYKQFLNREQPYVYTDYDLTSHQRQLCILNILTMGYLVFSAGVFANIENWYFGEALYFGISTFATIGLGDIRPESVLAKSILPLFATCGIVIVGSFIYSIRNVALELVALHLKISLEAKFHHEPLSVPATCTHRHPSPVKQSPSFDSRSPHLVPSSSSMSPLLHSDLLALDLAAQEVPELQLENQVSISRIGLNPSFSVVLQNQNEQMHLIQVTKKIFLKHLTFAFAGVLFNIVGFAIILTRLESWNIFEALYFAYCSISTIGFGDYYLTNTVSRALFIWYVIIGIASITYLSSMIAERALDQWTVQIQKIEQRVGRYERKAQLKKQFKESLNPSHILENQKRSYRLFSSSEY